MAYNSGMAPVPNSFEDTYMLDESNADAVLKKRNKMFTSIDLNNDAAGSGGSGPATTPLSSKRSPRNADASGSVGGNGEKGTVLAATADPNVSVSVAVASPQSARRALQAQESASSAAEAGKEGFFARLRRNRANKSAAAAAANINSFSSLLSAHVTLTKPRISLLVAMTSWWGYFLTVPHGAVDMTNLTGLTIGTLSLAAAASVINQIRETDVDARMTRTATRPLVSGKISIASAKRAVALYTALGAAVLTVVDPIAAGLGLFNVFLYGGVYTSLKRVTRLNTEIGAIVGAIPPLMGYAAALPADASFLTYDPVAMLWPAAVMIAWQMQHVMLICLRRSEDYNRSGLVMECLNDPSLMRTRTKGVAWAAVTTAVVAAPYWAGYMDIRHIFMVYVWGIYTALYASGALSKIPKQRVLLMALYLGYLILGATMWMSCVTKNKTEEDKYNDLMLNL